MVRRPVWEQKLSGSFDPGGMQAFRRRHPGPVSIVVAVDVIRPFERRYGTLHVRFGGLDRLACLLSGRATGLRR